MSELSPSSTPSSPVETVAAAERPSRGRSVAVVICVVLAGLLTMPAAVAYWGQRTLNDTERYVATVDPLVASPEVQDVIATRVTDAIQKQVDIEAILNNVFAGVITDRPRLEQLVGPLAAAVNGLIDRQVREFIASDEFADLWVRINTRAQQALHRVLTGEGSGAVTVQGDEVVLDVDEVINAVKERLVARGLTLVENVPIPETDRQIVLLESDGLEQLRTIYAFGNPVAIWMLPLVAALYLVAFALARRRPRMGVVIGVLLAANAVLLGLCPLDRAAAVRQPSRGHRVRPGEPGLLRHPAGVPRARAGRPARGRPGAGRRGMLRRPEQVRHRRPHHRGLGPRERRRACRWRPGRHRRSLGGSEPHVAACGRRCSSACWSCSGATRSPWSGCGGPWRRWSWPWPRSRFSSAPARTPARRNPRRRECGPSRHQERV